MSGVIYSTKHLKFQRMFRYTLLLIANFLVVSISYAQQNPNAVNCSGAVPGCDLPQFDISTDNSQDIQDFGVGTVSNPSSNPNAVPGNSGCLLTGETTSTFITIDVISNGTLEWSIQATQTACFDWIMWPNTPSICTDLQAGLQAPVACNWNGACGGFTGMAANGNLPAGASQSDFELALNVTAGESYLLCLSNYSQITSGVDFSFFGTAGVSCTPGTPDQTICEGSSATVDIIVNSPLTAPTYNWLVTTGVSNPTGGVGVVVTPPATTQYIVEIDDPNLTVPIMDTFTIFVETPQAPYAGPDQTICLGTPIQLDGTVDDPANNTFVWLHNVAQVSPTPTVNYVPNNNTEDPLVSVNQLGTYLFIFRETSAVCGNVFDTVEIVVDNIALTAASVSPSCQGVADGEIHITSALAADYSFDGGVTWQVDSFMMNLPAGNYSVCARSLLGCQQCINAVVTDPPPVVVSVSNDTTICENGTASMWASAIGGTTFDFHWDHTADLSANQQVNPLANTTYTVYAENENGCVSTPLSIDVSLHPSLTGAISMFDTICPGYPTDVFANVMGGIGQPYTFNWSSGQTQTGPANHQFSVNPPVTTQYTVTITDGCETTPLVLNTEVFVAPLPVPSYEVLNPEQCEPAVFTIVNTTDPALSQFNYWWVEPNDMYLNQDTITTDTLWAGSYDLQMVVTSYLGCVDSMYFTDALDVKPKPIAFFRHSPNPVLMFNTDVLFTNYSVGGYTYEWWFEEGYPSTSTQTNVQVSFPDGETGIYEIELVTTSELGCTDTMIYDLIVFPEVLIYAPNTFTPDGDEFNQTWRVFMEGIDLQDFELLIYNRWGELVWESHDISVGWDGTYGGKIVPTGTYTWVIRASDMQNDGKYTYNGHINLIK